MTRQSEKARLFLALWPSPETLQRLSAFSASLAWPPGTRRTPGPKLHITLHFIGDVARQRLPLLVDAFAVPSGELDLPFDGLETWGRGLVALVAHDTPQPLRRLHGDLACRLGHLDLPVEARPFRPHVTLARDVGERFAGALSEPILWRSSGHALVESAGGQYRNLATYR